MIAKETLSNPNHSHFISIASLWEISIKTALRKLEIRGSYESVIDDVNDNGIEILPIAFSHTVMQHQLPFHHRDPFDRIIISQAMVEGFDFISGDSVFDTYLMNQPIRRIW
jgi:PIN domain nuclease of toxin-antitoxin system